MRLALATSLAVLLSGCSGDPSPTYTTAPRPEDYLSRTATLQKVMPVAGKVSIAELILQLRQLEIVRETPPQGISGVDNLQESVVAEEGRFRVVDGIRAVEEALGWVFEPVNGDFYVARATHSVDDPDAFGRAGVAVRAPLGARPMVEIAFRFRRVSAGLSSAELSGGTDGTGFTASFPDGVQGTWSEVSERSFFEGVRDANSATASVVNTQRKIVTAGVDVTALVARLPGGMFRIDGRLSLSSFSGATADRAVVDFPLQLDGERGRWCRIVAIRGSDVGGRVDLKRIGFNATGSGSALELSVRVD